MCDETDKLYIQKMEEVKAEYPTCKITLVYGKLFDRAGWLQQMKNFWPDDMADIDVNFQQDLLKECSSDLQTDYGINTWTWQHSDDNKGFNQFVIGHTDYYILKEFIGKTDKIKYAITDIDWFLIPVIEEEDDYDEMIDCISHIEAEKKNNQK